MTDTAELIEIKVGAPLIADGGPLTESIHIQRYGLGWVVLCIMVKPGAERMRQFERAPVSLAVDQEGGALWWYLRIPGIIDWSAVPWPWWHSIESDRGPALELALVDAESTIVRAKRAVPMGEWAAKIEALTQKALAHGRDEDAHARRAEWSFTAKPTAVKRRATTAAVQVGDTPERRGRRGRTR